jgi:hypothetical protein
MYQLRHKDFTYAEANIDRGTLKVGQNPFQELITNSPEFDFDLQDIARCRNETSELITRLSEMYWAWRWGAGLSPNGMPSSVTALILTEAVAKPATDGKAPRGAAANADEPEHLTDTEEPVDLTDAEHPKASVEAKTKEEPVLVEKKPKEKPVLVHPTKAPRGAAANADEPEYLTDTDEPVDLTDTDTDRMPSGEVALRSRILTLEHRARRKFHYKTECQRLYAEANYLPWIAPVLGTTLKEHHICCPLCNEKQFLAKPSDTRKLEVTKHYKEEHDGWANSLVYAKVTTRGLQTWSGMDLALTCLQEAREEKPLKAEMGATLTATRCLIKERLGWAGCNTKHHRVCSSGKDHAKRHAHLDNDEANWARGLKDETGKRTFTEAQIIDPKVQTQLVRLCAKSIISQLDATFIKVFEAWERPGRMEVALEDYNIVGETIDLIFCHGMLLSRFMSMGGVEKFIQDPGKFVANALYGSKYKVSSEEVNDKESAEAKEPSEEENGDYKNSDGEAESAAAK